LLLTFFVGIEFLRAYETLRDLHPVAGYAFLVLLGAAGLSLGVYFGVAMMRRPAVLVPPPPQDIKTASLHALTGYAKHLRRVVQRLKQNPALTEADRLRLKDAEAALRGLFSRPVGPDTVRRTLAHIETCSLEPALTRLDSYAEREVRNCVRDVMAGVTLSPWRSGDLLIVLYRNIRMLTGVMHVYDSRPRLREQFLILRDIGAIVATVNILNYGSRLLQNLTASVPVLGRFTGDLAQGIGAGVFTSIAGHAAMDRCRAYRGWSRASARATIRDRLGIFLNDVKGIATDAVLPLLNARVEALAPEAPQRPDLCDRMRQGIVRAIDDTADAVELLVWQPAAATGRGVVSTGALIGRTLRDGAVLGLQGAKWSGRTVIKAAGRGAALSMHGVRAGSRYAARILRNRSGRHERDKTN
jgi:hypothetical protein